jgi:hypothetical protein
MCQTQTNELKTAANSIAMFSWVTYWRGDGISLHTTVWDSLGCLTRGEATLPFVPLPLVGFLTILRVDLIWGQGDPVLHQELCSFIGVYTSLSYPHQAFSRPSLSSLYACNTLSLRHSQNNRPLRPLWPQGPSIWATTQLWGITLQINKYLTTRLKSILSLKGSCYSSFGGRNRNIPHNPNCCKIWCQSSNDAGNTSHLCDCILRPSTHKWHQRSPITLATLNSNHKLKRLSWHWKPPWNLHKKLLPFNQPRGYGPLTWTPLNVNHSLISTIIWANKTCTE